MVLSSVPPRMSTAKLNKHTTNTLKLEKFIAQNSSVGAVRFFFFVTWKSSKTVENIYE